MIKMVVSKKNKDALTITDPNDAIFDSEKNTFKILTHGTYLSQLVNANPKTFAIAHGQSTIPGVYAFAKFPDGKTAIPNGWQRNNLLRTFDVEVDDTYIYLVFSSGTLSSETSTVGPGTTGNSNDIGTVSWSNDDRVVSINHSYATVTLTAETSKFLKCTNFGFSIPTGATITGIQMEVVGQWNTGSSGQWWTLDYIRIVKGNTIKSTNYTADIEGSNDTYAYVGGDGELWGETWTPSDINSSGFGVAIATYTAGGPNKISLDFIGLKVYYTTESGDYNVDIAYYVFEVPL